MGFLDIFNKKKLIRLEIEAEILKHTPVRIDALDKKMDYIKEKVDKILKDRCDEDCKK